MTLTLFLILGLLGGWLSLVPIARAAGITVSSTLDIIDGTDGLCTLREAVIAANTNTESGVTAGECAAGSAVDTDTITLAAGATYTLVIPNPAPTTVETDATQGDLDITGPLAIVVADGGTATIDANGGVTSDRAFEITSASVTITGVTIRNGQASAIDIGLGGGGFNVAAGGAILTSGSGALTLVDSTIRDNISGYLDLANPGTLVIGFGGGLSHNGSGVLRVISITITANSAFEGTGILLGGTGTAEVVNTTISGNLSLIPAQLGQSVGTGAAISSLNISAQTIGGGPVTIVNATIANNPVGLNALPVGSSVRHTILANTTTNCIGTVTEPPGDGYNIDTGISCGFNTADGSRLNTVPQLRPLGVYGGPTTTQPLLPTSPAIDAIPVVNCTDTTANPLATDQRGIARPQGTACDIGAVEVVPAPVVTTVTPNGGTTSGGTTITIAGSAFTAGSRVTVSGVACTNVVIAPTEITCTTPPNTAGVKDVAVINADGVSVSLTGAFTYRAPAITVVTPNSGLVGGGTPITIAGTDFVTGATATVGGRPCTAITVAVAQITCTTPPGAPGPADVVVTNLNAPGTSGTATLPGGFTYGTAQQAAPAPASLTFAAQPVNTTSGSQQVTLTNGGSTALIVSAVAITGANPSDFAVDGAPCVGSLAGGASCIVTVTFTPTASGSRGAILTFTTNSGGVSGSQQNVGLSGTGTAPSVAFSPTSLPFPNGAIGTTSPPQTLTLTNNGTAPLTITGVAIGGVNKTDFILTNSGNGACTGTVPVGMNCAVEVQFRPSAADLRVARVEFTNDANGQPGSVQSVPLSGGGIAPSSGPSPDGTFTVTASTQGSGTIAPAGATAYPSGTAATYSATPGTGQIFLGWTLDGNYVSFANSLTFAVGANRTLVATFAVRPSFTDVPTTDPDYQAIVFLAASGLINPAGVNGSGQFEPTRPVARAEVAAFIARTFGWDGEFHRNTFPDKCDAAGNCVDDELWNAVAALADYGVVGGYTDPTTCASAGTTAPCYLPRDTVSRLQVVSIVARAFTKAPDLRPTGYWNRLNADPSQYTNVPNTGTQRSDLTTYRANVGTVPGQTSDANFGDPNGNGTRRYVIQVLFAAFNAQFGTNNVP